MVWGFLVMVFPRGAGDKVSLSCINQQDVLDSITLLKGLIKEDGRIHVEAITTDCDIQGSRLAQPQQPDSTASPSPFT